MSKVVNKKASTAKPATANQQIHKVWFQMIILITGSQKNRQELLSVNKDLKKYYNGYVKGQKNVTCSQSWERDKYHGNIFIVTVNMATVKAITDDLVSTGVGPRVPLPPPPPPIMPPPHAIILYHGVPSMRESFDVEASFQ